MDRKRLAISLLAFGAISLAGVTANAEEGNWYAEGGFHFVNVDDAGLDVTVGLIGVNGGYAFANGFAIEALLAQGVLDDDIVFMAEDVSVGFGTTYGIAGKYTYDFNEKGRVYAKLRYTSIEAEVKVLGITVSDRESKVGWGVGGSFDVSERTYLIGEVNQFMEDSIGGFIGLGIRF